MADNLRFRSGPDTVAQRLGDETVLIHMKTDRMFVLNRTGTRLWELLCAGHDRADIQRRLLQEFDVSEPPLSEELDSLLISLQQEHLISADAES